MWVADVVYFPIETALLRAARQLGCRTMSGEGMAVFQAVRAFEHFTGIRCRDRDNAGRLRGLGGAGSVKLARMRVAGLLASFQRREERRKDKGRETMRPVLSRIMLAAAAATAIGISAHAAMAQQKVEITYSDTVPENDIRTATLRKAFGECLGDQFDFKDYHGATLFKQGTELTAMQRGNLDMADLAIYDLYNQVPETSILGAAYLYPQLRPHAEGLRLRRPQRPARRHRGQGARSRFCRTPTSARASST